MAQISFLPNKAYPSIPTIGADLESHSRALEAIREALQIHERRSKDVMSSFVRVEELIDMGLVELEKGSDTSVPTVVDDNPTEEPTSHRHDSLYIRLDGSSPPTDGEIDIGAGILMSNAQPINWLNEAVESVELIQFDGVSSGEVSWVSVSTLSSAFSTVETSFQTVTGLELTDLTVGEDYLLVSIPYLSGATSTSVLHEFQLFDNGTLIPESDVRFEPRSQSSARGRPYFFSKKITVAGDITAKALSVGGAYAVYVHEHSKLLAINLTEVGASGYEYDEDATGFADHGAPDVWKATGASLTFGDGAKDWIVFCNIHWVGNEGREVRMRLSNGSTHYPMIGYTPQDTTDEITQGGIVVMEAPASGTWIIESQQVSVNFANGVSFSSICAIDIDSLPSAFFSLTNPDVENFGSDRIVNSVSDTTVNTTEYLAIGVTSGDPGATNMETPTLRYNVDGGGDVEVEATFNTQVYGQGFQMFQIGVTAEIPAASTLELEMHHQGGDATEDTRWTSVLLLQMNGLAAPVETLQVGDPSYATRIDGLTTNITSPATDIDGTLNVDGTSAFNADVDLTTNAILTIWDAANTDKATITIKGDDLDIVGVGLSDLDIGGFTLARFQDVNVRISSSIGDTNYIEFEADGTDILATCYGTGSFIFRDIPDWIWIEDGCGLSIGADQTGAKNLYMWHDGTDFEFDFDGTTDWNISGITAINAGTVDADFDAITATSYGGILEANLLSRIVAEPISGAWVFNGELTFTDKLNAHVTTVTATSFTADDDHVILVDDDTAGSTVTITLPPAATANTIYHVKKLGSTANVIVDADGSETIDGSLTAVLTLQYESIMLISDGTNWNIL